VRTWSVFPNPVTNGMKFTAKDRDDDKMSGGNCAVIGNGSKAGGWWYNICLCHYTTQSSIQTH